MLNVLKKAKHKRYVDKMNKRNSIDYSEMNPKI